MEPPINLQHLTFDQNAPGGPLLNQILRRSRTHLLSAIEAEILIKAVQMFDCLPVSPPVPNLTRGLYRRDLSRYIDGNEWLAEEGFVINSIFPTPDLDTDAVRLFFPEGIEEGRIINIRITESRLLEDDGRQFIRSVIRGVGAIYHITPTFVHYL